ADHTAKLVEIEGLVQQVIPAHHLDELDETIGALHKLVEITECVDHDVKADQRDITGEVGLEKRPEPLAIEDTHVSTPTARRFVFVSERAELASMLDDLGINPHGQHGEHEVAEPEGLGRLHRALLAKVDSEENERIVKRDDRHEA